MRYKIKTQQGTYLDPSTYYLRQDGSVIYLIDGKERVLPGEFTVEVEFGFGQYKPCGGFRGNA